MGGGAHHLKLVKVIKTIDQERTLIAHAAGFGQKFKSIPALTQILSALTMKVKNF
jgi:hypothetical protein